MKAPIRICVLGNFSGRNAGDIAILAGLIHEVEARFDRPRFLVPTLNPGFVDKHLNQHHNVEAISLMPWALSAKIFGLPVLRAVLGADVVLITDNILFDRRLWNPLYNYLATLSLVLPIAARRGVPVVLYNASLGPISTRSGRWCLHRLMQVCELVILRDRPSQQLLERLDIPHAPPHFAADCALSTTPASDAEIDRIARAEGLFQREAGGGTIAFNVNTYLDVFLDRRGRHRDVGPLLDELARAIDRVIDALDVDVLFTVTQVMDLKVARPLMQRVTRQDRVKLIDNRTYRYDQIAGLLARCELLVGMRTHALILAASVGTPVLGIVSYLKTTGFMQSIEQGHRLIGFDGLNEEALVRQMLDTYHHRHATRRALQPIIVREKARAAHGAELLHQCLVGQLAASNPPADQPAPSAPMPRNPHHESSPRPTPDA
ncbi:MAG: polysaccharide pyruvyl transferase family protein [Phycisphaeraceae bacterium]